jgi:hypothetical protein
LAALAKLSSKEGMLQNSSSLPSTTWVWVKRAKAEHGEPPVAHPSAGASGETAASGDWQLVVSARQRLLAAEQQPSLQVPPVQQMSPGLPQREHTPSLPVHARPVLHWPATLLERQQDSPDPPHDAHVPLLHRSPS